MPGATGSGTLLPDWLAKRADLSPGTLAVRCDGTDWTFADLDRRVGKAAARLRGLGVVPGDRVAVLLRNGLPFVTLAHAIARAGAVLVPLNTRLAPAEAAWQVADCGAKLLVHADADAATAISAARAVEAAAVCDEGGEWLPAPERIDLDALHSLVYTSGTTGRPKGAMLTFGNLWWSAVGSALNLGLREDDRWLAVLPLFHVGGLSILARSTIYGIPAEVHDAFDPARVNRSIDDGVTIVSVVATMLQRMLDERGARPYPPTFRCALLGGGPAPRPLLEECARRGVPVVQTYGLTETASQAATLAPADALRKLGSAGKPLLPTEIRVEREDGVLAGVDEPGEILVRGPTVTHGYWNRPEETARALRGGWLRTGDLGRQDAEGYLYVLDRRADLIVSGGENVYPAEVEAALLAHPAVLDACVVGAADPEWGQVPVAAVVVRPRAHVDPEDVRAFCAERLGRYKVPTSIHVVAELPRNAGGKLRREVVREQVAGAAPVGGA